MTEGDGNNLARFVSLDFFMMMKLFIRFQYSYWFC